MATWVDTWKKLTELNIVVVVGVSLGVFRRPFDPVAKPATDRG